MQYDILIIGAGASGMMAGIVAARNKRKVLIIDKNAKTGRKICATGNGKCNYTNEKMGIEYFNSNNIDFVEKALNSFSKDDTIKFFKEIGVYPKVKNGYVYPYSEQSSSVSENMTDELKHLGVKIQLEECVKNINIEKNGKFTVITDNNKYTAEKVIVASGGKAAKKLGTDGEVINIIKKYGHSVRTMMPGLVSLKINNKSFKQISGVRLGAGVKVVVDNKMVASENGEIIFNDNGISGIPIMQISRHASKALYEKKDIYVEVDLMPDLTLEQLEKELKERKKNMPYKDNYYILIGMFNNKLAGYIDANNKSKSLKEIAKYIKQFKIKITDTNGFDNAQVMAGGISLEDVTANMESKIVKNMFFVGEILDVDGTCGGYNLQWAWTSGYIAGTAASK